MAASRKLFLTHSGELAHRLMQDVYRGGLVARFVRAYAERYGRYGLLSETERLSELESTIGREALLVMAAVVRRILPQAFAAGPKGALRAGDAAFVDAFYVEFLSSLSRGMDWPSGGGGSGETRSESEMFRRDLGMYLGWSHRPVLGSDGGSLARAGESPFRDRCALLLDPAMMEQARGEAADFENEILRVAAQRFGQLGRVHTFTAKPMRRRAAKAVPRRRVQAQPRGGAKVAGRNAQSKTKSKAKSSVKSARGATKAKARLAKAAPGKKRKSAVRRESSRD